MRCLIPLLALAAAAFALVLDRIVTFAEARLLVWRPKQAETETL